MESGELASLAFIGTARVANLLKRQHPRPNRLRCILGLEAKNPAIVLADADLDLAVAECVRGALSYNGQRCTGLKILFIARPLAERFVARLADAVDALPFGLPWDKGVQVTPLPEQDKPRTLARFVDDAVARGAVRANQHGGASDASFFFPQVLYPVREGARLWHEEQFGPVVPVAPFDDLSEVLDFVTQASYGQQASVFGRDPRVIGPLADVLANQVCRVNLNAQCQRGPDVYPFTGRKDSAVGTLSVYDALRTFSIRSMVAVPQKQGGLLGELGRSSKFLAPPGA
jgi:glyceraldehyde-3-phosphate dehydrogenase (NADP+)